jgi:hypothetical protein
MTCECGCGALITPDDRGRPRRFVNGHNGRGQPLSPEHRQKVADALTGKKHDAERRRKNALAPKPRGPVNGRWRGDEAGYGAKHGWRVRNRPKAGFCADCGAEDKTEWANISGEYRREDESDWIELCLSCHRRRDALHPVRKQVA